MVRAVSQIAGCLSGMSVEMLPTDHASKTAHIDEVLLTALYPEVCEDEGGCLAMSTQLTDLC